MIQTLTFHSIIGTKLICVVAGSPDAPCYTCHERLFQTEFKSFLGLFRDFEDALGLRLMDSKSCEVASLTLTELPGHTAESATLGSFNDRTYTTCVDRMLRCLKA